MDTSRRTPRPHGEKATPGNTRAGSRAPKRHALPRVVFIVGPTSSGKTDLGLRIAHLFDGEVVNADARQVYRDITIGTGKPRGKRKRLGNHSAYMVDGIPHYLMDFLVPTKAYSVAEWRNHALKAIRGITRRGKLPIVVGGTGLYVQSLIDNYQFPAVEPQPAMRTALETKNLDDLVRVLLSVDPAAADVVDLKNKRRVIRAIEVVTFSGQKFSEARAKSDPLVEALQLGIRRPSEELLERMERSIDNMFKEGLVDEVKKLLKKGVPVDAPSMTSIGYNDVARALAGEITLDDAKALVKRRTRQYTKRQITWFKRDQRIQWVQTYEEGVELVKHWMTGGKGSATH